MFVLHQVQVWPPPSHRGPSTESQQHHPGPAGKSRGPGSSPSDTNPEVPHTDTEERASSTCDVDMGLRTPSSKQEAHAACEERRSSDGLTMSKGHPRGRAVMGRGGRGPRGARTEGITPSLSPLGASIVSSCWARFWRRVE